MIFILEAGYPTHSRISKSFVYCRWAGGEIAEIVRENYISRCKECQAILEVR